MRVSDRVGCGTFPCEDVRHECYAVPEVNVGAHRRPACPSVDSARRVR